MKTLRDLISHGADADTALSVPEGDTLTFSALRSLADRTVADLNAHGIRRGDRVAIVLPNGPAMAAAFIAIAAGATAAPLNPAYKADKLEFYLRDLGAKLLVTADGTEPMGADAARKLGVPVARLRTEHRRAGEFILMFETGPTIAAESSGWARPEDVALVLHTSGTTSKPKVVPLTQANICASARNIRESLRFEHDDRGLNIMPLFHIHGLIAGILAPLSAGGEVCCTPGHSISRFFNWMEMVGPTWFTAVPTMHQDILSRVKDHPRIVAANRLRFIRSCSSSLPPVVMRGVEEAFGAPVIEAYGMTEAAHQVASNPLPPSPRVAGSVGIATGVEIAIVDEEGELLTAGSCGEIVIRGENVMSGYEDNTAANSIAFTRHGYFRTGDLGVLSSEGHLSLTGRLKEIIIRGGEKISPWEVEEVLMKHPSVLLCVTFAVPHARLGEDVAAAVVLREGTTSNEAEIRAFAAANLARFKVPAKILFLDSIPCGDTGKPQRNGLAQTLRLA